MTEKKRNAFTTMFGGTMGCLAALMFVPVCCIATCAFVASQVDDVRDDAEKQQNKTQKTEARKTQR